jgi:signal transduction histidine kinase
MDSALVIALSILGGLILLIVWQDADTLQDALDQVMNSNRALQASEELLARHADELAESRARVVAATDRERRRIERDLHDGAQQRLVALAVNLLVARQQSEAEPARSRVLLDQVADQLQVAIAEIRDLAHGIYPPLLANRGLAEALPAAVARAPLPARVVTSDIGRYPPHVEAAVYFCCLEGLQNAAKHAGPTASVTITVTGSGRGLEFEIIDTGVGFDTTDAGRGSGLVNMADRLAVVGGTLAIESRPQCGTRIIGTIPIPAHNITHDVSSR